RLQAALRGAQRNPRRRRPPRHPHPRPRTGHRPRRARHRPARHDLRRAPPHRHPRRPGPNPRRHVPRTDPPHRHPPRPPRGHRLPGTLAAEAGTLDAMSRELTRLTATLTAHRGDIASGVNGLALLSTTLRQSNRDLNRVLEDGPGAMRNVHALLQEARPGRDCLLTAAATPTAPLMTAENSRKINHVLRLVPTLQALVADVTAAEPRGP